MKGGSSEGGLELERRQRRRERDGGDAVVGALEEERR